MYSFKSKVRYSEVNQNKQLHLASIINYFQDCSTFQSEELGVGLSHLASLHHIWLMSAWQIIISHLPVLGETIMINTWPYDFQGIYGYRNFTLTDSQGNVAVAANSIWIYLNTDTGRPQKITSDVSDTYLCEPRYSMEYTDRKIILPQEYSEKETFAVTRNNLDTNMHVNNGQYVRMAEDYLPDGFSIKQMRADYRKSATLGNLIYPRVYEKESCCIVSLADQTGAPYAILEFTPTSRHGSKQ